jgi:hypothetical protein
MVKYFAEYRISDPRRAITYVQLAIWFHVLVGIAEIGVLGLFASALMPKTGLAFLSWIVILHSIVQFPGLVPDFPGSVPGDAAVRLFDFSCRDRLRAESFWYRQLAASTDGIGD